MARLLRAILLLDDTIPPVLRRAQGEVATLVSAIRAANAARRGDAPPSEPETE